MSTFALQDEADFAKEWSCSPLSSMEPSQEPQTNAMENVENEVERHLDFTTSNKWNGMVVACTENLQNLASSSSDGSSTNVNKNKWNEMCAYNNNNNVDNIEVRLLELLELFLSKPRVSGGYSNYITFTEFMELIAAMHWREVEGEECWYDVVRGEPCHRTSNMTRLCCYICDYSATRHTQEIDFHYLSKFLSDRLHNAQSKTKMKENCNNECKGYSSEEKVSSTIIVNSPLCLHETNLPETQNEHNVALDKRKSDESKQDMKIKACNVEINASQLTNRSFSPINEETEICNKYDTRDKIDENYITDNVFCRYRIPTRSSLYRWYNNRTNVNAKISKSKSNKTNGRTCNSNTRNNKQINEQLAGESVFERLYAHASKKLHSENKELSTLITEQQQQLIEQEDAERNMETVNVYCKGNTTPNNMSTYRAPQNVTIMNANHRQEMTSRSEPKLHSGMSVIPENKNKRELSRDNVQDEKISKEHKRYSVINNNNNTKVNSYLEIQQKEQERQRQRSLHQSLLKESPHGTVKSDNVKSGNETVNSAMTSFRTMHYNVPTASFTARLSCAEEVHYDPLLQTPSTPREKYHAPPQLPRFVPPRYIETVARLRRAASLGCTKRFEEQLREDAEERKMHENARRQLLANTAILRLPVVNDDTNNKTLSVNIRLSNTFCVNTK